MMTEKIKLVLVKRNMKMSELARAINNSPANIYHKFKRDNFTEKELKKIAEVLDCTYEANFVMNDTGEKY